MIPERIIFVSRGITLLLHVYLYKVSALVFGGLLLILRNVCQPQAGKKKKKDGKRGNTNRQSQPNLYEIYFVHISASLKSHHKAIKNTEKR